MQKVEHIKCGKQGGYLHADGYLLKNLEIIKKAVMKDRDAIIVVDGFEGSGMSVMALHISKTINSLLERSRHADCRDTRPYFSCWENLF